MRAWGGALIFAGGLGSLLAPASEVEVQYLAHIVIGTALAGKAVATAGEVCSPPQAARTLRSDRHSSITVEVIPVLVGLSQIDFMALFSAPGKVRSMPRKVYPPGVRFDSAGNSRCAVPRGSADGKKTPARGKGLSHSPADGG